MKHHPTQNLREYIDCYLIVENANNFFGNNNQKLTAYPGVSPELLIPLNGSFRYHYKGRWVQSAVPTVFNFIEEKLVFDHSNLKSFIIVQFRPFALLAIRQFTALTAKVLIANPICHAEEMFTKQISTLIPLIKMQNLANTIEKLDHFFLGCLNQKTNSLVKDIMGKLIQAKRLKDMDLSYATIERHFKSETGLTPKKFQSIQRCKSAVQEIYHTGNNDWIHYVVKYNFFDQSHFVKEIKRYTSFTPSQLHLTPALLDYRTIASDDFLQ